MELPTSVGKWTKEDVRLWLMTVVKVHETYANIFFEEEVSGDMLVYFEKKDILDLGIHHGPAVKITSYLESLKEGSEYESQFPAYVKNWTKEQVNQWLQQHLRVYIKYAERLQEEDVSGDCIVCFKKQDFLDLALKNGPAVKILAELRQLKMKPEPTLQPVLHNSTDPRESPKPTQPELVLSQDIAIKQPDSCHEIESKTDNILVKESEKVQLPFQKVSEKEGIYQPQYLGARRKGAIMVKSVLEYIHSYHSPTKEHCGNPENSGRPFRR
ncbi:sterile alpha motif domain-containing protein 9-like [Pseudoliparis swirei]|uniref:sterile alpha motif domain-containing protein 9-like n=1 Tax=Pseudoliparis swirei TaxID=2059687 RepID=UPI0024BED25A|nr:sterile alpha motif domain-containing protein 9-like [Pseudoliparis swirei]